MAILKYYKVGSDGKIQRLRRECKWNRIAQKSAQLTLRPRPHLWCRCLHGLAQGPTGLRKVWSYLHFRGGHQAHRRLSTVAILRACRTGLYVVLDMHLVPLQILPMLLQTDIAITSPQLVVSPHTGPTNWKSNLRTTPDRASGWCYGQLARTLGAHLICVHHHPHRSGPQDRFTKWHNRHPCPLSRGGPRGLQRSWQDVHSWD